MSENIPPTGETRAQKAARLAAVEAARASGSPPLPNTPNPPISPAHEGSPPAPEPEPTPPPPVWTHDPDFVPFDRAAIPDDPVLDALNLLPPTPNRRVTAPFIGRASTVPPAGEVDPALLRALEDAVAAGSLPQTTSEAFRQKGKLAGNTLKDAGRSYLEMIFPRNTNPYVWGLGLISSLGVTAFGGDSVRITLGLAINSALFLKNAHERLSIRFQAAKTTRDLGVSGTDGNNRYVAVIDEIARQRGKERIDSDEFTELLFTAFNEMGVDSDEIARRIEDEVKKYESIVVHNSRVDKAAKALTSGIATGFIAGLASHLVTGLLDWGANVGAQIASETSVAVAPALVATQKPIMLAEIDNSAEINMGLHEAREILKNAGIEIDEATLHSAGELENGEIVNAETVRRRAIELVAGSQLNKLMETSGPTSSSNMITLAKSLSEQGMQPDIQGKTGVKFLEILMTNINNPNLYLNKIEGIDSLDKLKGLFSLAKTGDPGALSQVHQLFQSTNPEMLKMPANWRLELGYQYGF